MRGRSSKKAAPTHVLSTHLGCTSAGCRRPGSAYLQIVNKKKGNVSGAFETPAREAEASAGPNSGFGRACRPAATPPFGDNEMLILTIFRFVQEIVTEAMVLRRELRRRYRPTEE